MATALEAMLGVILLFLAFGVGALVGRLRQKDTVARWLDRYGCWNCKDKHEDLRLWRDDE